MNPTHRTVIEGDGLPIGPDSLIVTRLASYEVDGRGENAGPTFSTFSGGPDVLFTAADFAAVFSGAGDVGNDWKNGTRLIASGSGPPVSGEGSSSQDTATVHVLDILDHYVAGQTVPGEQVESAGALSGVDVTDNRHPKTVSTENPVPEQLEAITLIEGGGEPVRDGDRIVVQFAGVTWTTGEVFGSTWKWNGRPSAYSIGTGQILPGWDEALPGVPPAAGSC
nr:FKBP-type peptidyl-prolyl cis-trans isomerase [Nocardiopsis ansamitocini]